MTKKAIGFTVVLISLVMAVPLSAKGPATGKNGRSPGILTGEEIEHITYMREEEKLARDVYLMLYEVYEASIFANISESEQRHMDAIKKLIEKYGLEDPVADDTVGAFPVPETDKDTDFKLLYDELVALGDKSYCEALKVGIYIEELDIEDIENALNDVEAPDVTRVLNNLLNGSYNHLNAFTSRYKANNCEE
jgi:hypothetical protein